MQAEDGIVKRGATRESVVWTRCVNSAMFMCDEWTECAACVKEGLAA
jgi:hypothetical protein